MPLAVALALRLIAVAIAAAVPSLGHKLTSTDEARFMATTRQLAKLPLDSHAWVTSLVHSTQVIPWALTYKLFGDCGSFPLRLEQIALSLIAITGVSLLASRLGGRRAGLIAAWILAVEPSSVYFAGLLHQESLCTVGEALLLWALVDCWLRDHGWRRPVLVGIVGVALIFGTRSYMAFFAGVAVVLVLVGAVAQRRFGTGRSLAGLTAGAVVLALVGIVLAPHVVPGSLVNLQNQLDYRYAGANLSLPRATVTDAGGLLRTVISRSFDLLVKPFPWQTGDTAQKAAVAGTLVWYALLIVTFWLAVGGLLAGRNRGQQSCLRAETTDIPSFLPSSGSGAGKQGPAMVRSRVDSALAPVAILFLCETVGFALTLVDTGEGFRHRVNLVLLLSMPLGVMLSGWWETRRATDRTLDLAAAA